MAMIPLFSTHIPKLAGEEVKRLIESGWLNRGKKAELFEQSFMKMFGCNNALSVNSCTSALRLAYDIAKSIAKEDKRINPEIITTPYTMIATNTALLECRIRPVFVDINYETININPDDIENNITDDTIAIVGVDYAGLPCDWNKINRIAKKYDLIVIQDAAQALGAKYCGSDINKWTDMTCYSFQAIKHITTGDGGMFVTINPFIAELAKRKIWFGIDKDARIQTELGTVFPDITTLGFKYAMNDVSATMGIEGLKDLEWILKRRAEIAKQYREELMGVKDLLPTQYDGDKMESANWLFPIHVKRRSKFAKKMRNMGIEVAVHNWRNDIYTVFYNSKTSELKNVQRINDDLIHIPLHAELTQEQVNYIIRTIKGMRW